MIQAAVYGASGYGGVELLRLLLQHPEVRVRQATSREAGRRVDAAEALAKGGRVLQALAALEGVARDFAPCTSAERARRAGEKLGADARATAARKLHNRILLAEKHSASGANDKARETLETTLKRLEPGSDPWLRERCEELLAGLP